MLNHSILIISPRLKHVCVFNKLCTIFGLTFFNSAIQDSGKLSGIPVELMEAVCNHIGPLFHMELRDNSSGVTPRLGISAGLHVLHSDPSN